MPHRRSKSIFTGLAASTGLLLFRSANAAGFDGSSNVALYWGQNSYNQASGNLSQQTLATYCANTDIDIIPMAFMVQITSGQGEQPVINFANQQNNCTAISGTALLDCPQIGDDIKTCQRKYGKTILLSIGGATYTEGGFESKDAAVAAANLVWEIFGPVSGSSSSNDTSSSSATPSLTNSTSLVGSAHSTTIANTTAPALATGTGHITASKLTKTATTTITPLLSTGLGTNSTSTVKGNKVKSRTKLTETTAATSNADILTVVTTFVTTLKKSSSTISKTHKNKPAETHSTISQSSQTLLDKAAHPTSRVLHSTGTHKNKHAEITTSSPHSSKTHKNEQAETSSKATQSTRTLKIGHGIASTTSSTTKASSTEPATTAANAETLDYSTTHARRQSNTNRPFGDAVIDGFDLDLETAVQNFNSFANQLRSLMDADTSKKYYLTAAPQCPYPDAADDSMLNGGAGVEKVKFDAVFVQFYNNYCGTQSFTPNTTTSSTQSSFNFAQWDTWATTLSAKKDVKVFLGVPAGQSAAGTGYMSAEALKPVIEYCKTFGSFGGVMAWDASQAYANTGFLEGVKDALGDGTKRRRLVRRYISKEWWS